MHPAPVFLLQGGPAAAAPACTVLGAAISARKSNARIGIGCNNSNGMLNWLSDSKQHSWKLPRTHQRNRVHAASRHCSEAEALSLVVTRSRTEMTVDTGLDASDRRNSICRFNSLSEHRWARQCRIAVHRCSIRCATTMRDSENEDLRSWATVRSGETGGATTPSQHTQMK